MPAPDDRFVCLAFIVFLLIISKYLFLALLSSSLSSFAIVLRRIHHASSDLMASDEIKIERLETLTGW